MSPTEPPPILLYDGVCGLCNRFVQFVLRHDREGRFRFAPLQSGLADTILRRHGRDPAQLSTVVLVLEPDTPSERLLIKARAALYVLRTLGAAGRLLAPLAWLPTPVLDLGYDLVARNRYRVFGQSDQCMMPSPDQRARFLDLTPRADLP